MSVSVVVTHQERKASQRTRLFTGKFDESSFCSSANDSLRYLAECERDSSILWIGGAVRSRAKELASTGRPSGELAHLRSFHSTSIVGNSYSMNKYIRCVFLCHEITEATEDFASSEAAKTERVHRYCVFNTILRKPLRRFQHLWGGSMNTKQFL